MSVELIVATLVTAYAVAVALGMCVGVGTVQRISRGLN
jgi:hypothetical protein